jgi:transcriptional antiterminator NusG
MEWYSLQVYSTFELFVKGAINRMVIENNLENQLGEIMVPTEDIISYKKGVEVITEKSIYPGYVFFQADLDINLQHKIQGITKVSGFVGEKGLPSKLSVKDIEHIQNKIKNKQAPRHKTEFEQNEEILITSGSFENYKGNVVSFDPKTGLLNINVIILGRETPIEISVDSISRID